VDWQFRQGRRALELEPELRLRMNDGEAVAAGMGLAQVPDDMAKAARPSGRAVEVLADGRPAPLPISLVYPSGRMVTPRLRVLIDAFTAGPVHALPELPGQPARRQRLTPSRRRR
jgi:LysR family transcriptional regulator, regulator for bpeEF and oprC